MRCWVCSVFLAPDTCNNAYRPIFTTCVAFISSSALSASLWRCHQLQSQHLQPVRLFFRRERVILGTEFVQLGRARRRLHLYFEKMGARSPSLVLPPKVRSKETGFFWLVCAEKTAQESETEAWPIQGSRTGPETRLGPQERACSGQPSRGAGGHLRVSCVLHARKDPAVGFWRTSSLGSVTKGHALA